MSKPDEPTVEMKAYLLVQRTLARAKGREDRVKLIDAIRARIERKVSREWVAEKTRGVSVIVSGVVGIHKTFCMNGFTWLMAMLRELGYEVEE